MLVYEVSIWSWYVIDHRKGGSYVSTHIRSKIFIFIFFKNIHIWVLTCDHLWNAHIWTFTKLAYELICDHSYPNTNIYFYIFSKNDHIWAFICEHFGMIAYEHWQCWYMSVRIWSYTKPICEHWVVLTCDYAPNHIWLFKLDDHILPTYDHIPTYTYIWSYVRIWWSHMSMHVYELTYE